MVGVHHRVYRDEIGNQIISVILVQLKELVGEAGGDHKHIFFQQGQFLLRQIELIQIDHIGEIIGDFIGWDGRCHGFRVIGQREVQQLQPPSNVRWEGCGKG